MLYFLSFLWRSEVKTLGTLLLALFLIGCGGGSDTSSDAGSSTTGSAAAGGGSGSAPSNANSSAAAGTSSAATSTTYKGTIAVTLSAPGYPDTDKSTPVTVVITGSSVRLTAEGRTVSTRLNGNTFSANVPINETRDGIICSGTATVNGNVNGGTISGPVTGSGTCNVGGQNVPVTVAGRINARS